MSKTDLFRQIGWSQELIEHFTIVNDDADSRIDIVDDVAETFEATTVRYNKVRKLKNGQTERHSLQALVE